MTDCRQNRSVSSRNSSSQNSAQGITEEDARVTAVLASRPSRQPDLAAEVQALQTLAQQLMGDFQVTLKTLVGFVLNHCQAGTVGISLLETAPNGESVFRWVAIAGAFADLEQTTIPGDFSPCGMTLRTNQPQLYAYPERCFTYLHHPQFPIVEELIIPLRVNRQPLGTLWLLSHDEARRFDLEDQRLMMSLAGFAAAVLQSLAPLGQQAEDTLQREQEADMESEERLREAHATRTQVALLQSEALNQQIFNNSDDCLKVLDLSGRLLYMNLRGQALIGIEDLAVFLNRSWVEFWQEDDKQAALKALDSAKAGGVGSFQGYCPTLAGEPKWWDVKLTPVRGVDGQVERLLCISRDITERKQIEAQRQQAEAALRESEENFRAMFNASSSGKAQADAKTRRLLRVNPALCQITGYSESELLTMTVDDLNHPEDRERDRKLYQDLVSRITDKYQLETRYIRKDGSIVWVNVIGNVIHDANGNPLRTVAIIQDISDRKQAEVAIAADLRDTQLLRDLSARFTTEADSQVLYDEIVATAIALMRSDAGSFQVLDPATQELLLLAAQGFGPSMTGHFDRVDASFNTSCAIALATGERAFVDFDVPKSEDPKGYRRMHVEAGLLSAQSTPLISRSGKLIGMVSTHWRTHHRPSERELRFLDLLARQAADLLEQQQADAQRRQLLTQEQAAREEAERANRVKDEFLTVLSHELRTPLNPILGWSTLLLNKKLDEAKMAHALATIQRNARLQSELIEDLLDVSRILSGKLSLNVASVNLVATILGAIETVRLAAEAKSIKVEASLAPDIGLVAGDSTRLQQVIWNLLSNGVKFTPPGGQISIRLERFNSYAHITVSDTGRGIAPDFLPYIFDHFRQADGSTTRNFGGLGLGLAIVRYLVELHGGTVRAESLGEGQGATFIVRLPVMPTPPEANQDEQFPEQALDLKDIKILIVDDETDTRELVAFILEQQRAQVTTVSSAYEALVALPQVKPDVLLSDIGMPGMDGYMLIQQVRTLAPVQGGQVPAIALTAYAGEINQQQAIAAGFQKHISKPIDPEVLIQTIAHLVRPA
jgi:PAS domain S-box-containing protein